MANDFLQFCSTDTGSNLLTESEYLASADRISGNKPGVASAKLVNRSLRQANYITSQLAQLLANGTGTDVLDDATPAKLLAQLVGFLQPYAPSITRYASSSGSFNLTYIFGIATGSATAGATYTNNGHTFTVKATVASGVALYATGDGYPSVSGTLTKASGTGDSSITFYVVRRPLFINVEAIGAGGGGAGSGVNAGGSTDGGIGGDTSFGTTLIVAGGGAGGGAQSGSVGGAGGSATLGTGPFGIAVAGGHGGGGQASQTSTNNMQGGEGAASYYGGGGGSGGNQQVGYPGTPNTGGGGGGAGTDNQAGLQFSGGGGGSGGFVSGTILAPLSAYNYVIGSGGTSGSAGTNGHPGGLGGSGAITVWEFYQ